MSRDFKVFYLETREKITSKVTGEVEYSVEAIGKDIVQLISYLQLKENEYVLYGSSLGGTAILDCMRHLKIDPLCLILVGPNAIFKIPKYGVVLINMFYPSLYNIFKPYVKWYLKSFRLDIEADHEQYEKYCTSLDAADPWKLKKIALAVSKYQVWELLSKISMPTLVIGASKDNLHEPENLHKMVGLIPKAEYLDLETNKGTHSKKVVEALREYVGRVKKGLG